MQTVDTEDIGTYEIRRGDRFALPFLGELDGDDNLVNLATYGPNWKAQLRPRAESAIFVEFAIDKSNIAGLVDSGRDAWQLVLSLTDAQTRAMTASSYVFDVEVSGGAIGTKTLYEGTVRMTGDVTRNA